MPPDTEASPCRVRIKDEGLSAALTIAAGAAPGATTRMLCLGALGEESVQITPEVARAVDELLALHEKTPDAEQTMIVARGKPPVHGADGWLELMPQFDPDQLGKDNEEPNTDGAKGAGGSRTDHRSRSAFMLARAGDHLATLHPPGDAEDGVNLSGEIIAAKLGKDLPINTDESVIVRSNGVIEAAICGVVAIEGRKVRVLERLVIHGALDFSTGNVDFPGDIQIDKGVKDGFRAVAKRDIQVRGLVEAATVRAGRDLELQGGAACREKGECSAGRDLNARYLNECDCHVGRNAVVEREIINVKMSVGADLLAPNCTIIGGSIYVTGACQLSEVGSERNIPTVLTLGADRKAEELKGRAEEVLGRISDQLGKVQGKFDQLRRNTAKLTPTQAEQVTELQFEIGTFSRLQNNLTGALGKLDEVVGEVATVDLIIQKLLWRGTTLLLPGWEVIIHESLKGPLRISLNERGKPILTDLTADSSVELSTVAKVRSRIEDEGADEATAA